MGYYSQNDYDNAEPDCEAEIVGRCTQCGGVVDIGYSDGVYYVTPCQSCCVEE